MPTKPGVGPRISKMLPIVCASGNFVVALGVFVVIGLVTPIATAYHTTPDAAGLVVTWYAVAFALTAPIWFDPLTVTLNSQPIRR